MIEPNAPLLQGTLAHIRENPDTWNQAIYRMEGAHGTVGCYATWACELAGGVWYGLVALVTVPADDPRDVFPVGNVNVIDIDHRARRILGLSYDQAADLFHPSNNLPYLEQAVRELCDGTAPVADFADARRRREQQLHHEQRLRDELHSLVDHIEPKPTIIRTIRGAIEK